MDTFLFAWNPKKWNWKEAELTEQVLTVAETGSAEDRWSSGNRKQLPIGSRFFLVRLGEEPKGIVGSGYTTSNPEFNEHWDPELQRHGKEALFVDLEFDFLSKQPLISLRELERFPFANFDWSIQASGVQIPNSIAQPLEQLWKSRTGGGNASLPEEIPTDIKFVEGAKKRVSINAYEHNPQARAACIAHFGFQCGGCDLVMEDRYGDIAKEFIHVHHLVPLATIGRSYQVNPRKDLRPLCPNCHAIIHRREPPLSISQLRRLLRKSLG